MTGYMRKVVQTVKHTHARPFRHWRACASLHLKGARQIRFTARDVFSLARGLPASQAHGWCYGGGNMATSLVHAPPPFSPMHGEL